MSATNIDNAMSIPKVQAAVRHIADIAGDDEMAHWEEDRLHRSVLATIRERPDDVDVAELAAEALKTTEIRFARWCA